MNKHMDNHLLKILACPKCLGDLTFENEVLACAKCKLEYPVRNGIPVLIVEEAKQL